MAICQQLTNYHELCINYQTITMATVPAQFAEGGDCVVGELGCTLVAGGPDTADKEWFINLNDNRILIHRMVAIPYLGALLIME